MGGVGRVPVPTGNERTRRSPYYRLATTDYCVRHVARCLLRLAEVPASSRCISIEIAIDDFGTGQSSMAQLKDLPVDIVKVDQSFITGLADDPIDQAIVAAIIGFGHALDVEVVAEGIETPEDLRALVALGASGPRGSSLGA